MSASVDAAAGAAHDLDELILGGACLDLIQQNLCGTHAGSDGYIYGGAVDVDGCLADSCVMTTYLGKCDGLMLLAGQLEVYGTKRSFHYTAGDTEDYAGAGVVAHDVLIPVLVGQTVEHDTASLDHLCQLSGGDDCIHIRNAVHLKLLALTLELLSHTGHYGYYEDILRIDALLLSPVGLQDSTLHLMRRFAGGKVGQKI